MSNNPFQAPTPQSPQKLPSQQPPQMIGVPATPVGVTVISILCLVLGLAGVLGSCTGGIGVIVQLAVFSNISSTGGASQQAQDLFAMQQSQLLPSLIIVVLNLFVAPTLITGAIGVLSRRKWARRILRLGLIAAIFYLVVKLICMGYSQYVASQYMQSMGTQSGMGGFENNMGMIMLIQFGVMAVFFLAIGLFYGFALIYLKSKTANAYFATFES